MALDRLFGTIADTGLAAIELWGRQDDFEQVVQLAKQHGLAVASMIGHASLSDGLNKRSNHDRIEAELRESIEVAAHYGIPGLMYSANTHRRP
jgi:sugar phosphate isomerase/epimerase